MKRFLIAVALTCALSSSALAGLIPSVGAPESSETTVSATSTSTGLIPSDGVAKQVSGDALSAILSVLSFVIR